MEKLKTLQELNKVLPVNYRPRYQKEENEISDEELISYRKLKYGTRAYSESELLSMSSKEKKSVIYKQEKANEIINEMAQNKLNSYVIKLMKKVFPDLTGDAANIFTQPVFYGGFVVDNSIKPLKVTQEEIIEEFKRKGLM